MDVRGTTSPWMAVDVVFIYEVQHSHDSNRTFEVRTPPWMARCRMAIDVVFIISLATSCESVV